MAEAFLSSEVPAFLSVHIPGWPHGPWSRMILGSFLCIQPFCADTGGVHKGGIDTPNRFFSVNIKKIDLLLLFFHLLFP